MAEGGGVIPESLRPAQPDWDSFCSLTRPSSLHSSSSTCWIPLPASCLLADLTPGTRAFLLWVPAGLKVTNHFPRQEIFAAKARRIWANRDVEASGSSDTFFGRTQPIASPLSLSSGSPRPVLTRAPVACHSARGEHWRTRANTGQHGRTLAWKQVLVPSEKKSKCLSGRQGRHQALDVESSLCKGPGASSLMSLRKASCPPLLLGHEGSEATLPRRKPREQERAQNKEGCEYAERGVWTCIDISDHFKRELNLRF